LKSLPLKGITIIDLSWRLPGPFAAKILQNLGAKVIKIENKDFLDPFSHSLIEKEDPSFHAWYESLNKEKEIVTIDFNHAEEKKQLLELITGSDGVIIGMPPKYHEGDSLIKYIQNNIGKPISLIELKASKTGEVLHDLNALGRTALLSLYTLGKSENILAPPFIPIAGITFGHHVAINLLASLLKARKENKVQFTQLYLDETIKEVADLILPREMNMQKNQRFLHNGLFPCYSLYRTKEGNYLAVACIEEKFWTKFIQLLRLELKAEDRFNSSNEIFKIISDKIFSLSKIELQLILKDQNICVSLV
jgi:crotonobetainyl-CoA:carnitine CoA-transferase CaiB-like acyl-CoA transferase